MNIFKFIALIFALASELAFSNSPFCLQSKNGLNCVYQEEVDCEAVKGEHEFCMINPFLFKAEQEKTVFLKSPDTTKALCFGIACIQYIQGPCTDAEERIEDPIRCESND